MFKTKKAFTLIELIVVIVVIGILVLLATPRFAAKAETAKVAQIKNDVRAVENEMALKLTLENIKFDEDLSISFEDLNYNIGDNIVYNRRGQINDINPMEKSSYLLVNDNILKEVKTRLKGEFYFNSGGIVYYVRNKNENRKQKVDKSALERVINEAEVLDPTDYDDFTDVDQKLTTAKDVRDNNDATQKEVNKATKDLEDAINGLRKIYTVIFKDYDETILKSEKVIHGESATAPEEPSSKEGFLFKGWDKPFVSVVDNLIITAEYKQGNFEWIVSDYGNVYTAKNELGEGYYKYVGNEEYVDIPHEINGHPMTSYYKMFYESKNTIKEVSNSNYNIIDMSNMFYNSEITNLDLSNFATSGVENMSEMFNNSAANKLDLSSFDTSNVINMEKMFYNSSAKELNLSNFDTSNVTNMRYMFFSTKPTELDLSSFDTSGVENMSYMFDNSEATKLNLSKLDTSNVINMEKMFHNSRATELNLLNFDTSNVINMRYMFSGTKTTELDLSSFDTSSVKNMSYMFNGAEATKLNISKLNTSNVTDMEKMFYKSSATELDLSSFNTSNVTNMRYMLSDTKTIKLDLSNFNTSKVTDMSYMFDSSKVTELNLSKLDTSNVTNMEKMFYESKIIKLNLNNFNTSKVTNMKKMFHNSISTELNLSSFDTSNVTNMEEMFHNSFVTELDLSSFDTSNVTNMDKMFYNSIATEGYAKTLSDANNFNASSDKPTGLEFIVKSQIP